METEIIRIIMEMKIRTQLTNSHHNNSIKINNNKTIKYRMSRTSSHNLCFTLKISIAQLVT